ncbi:hypothetical protein CCHR01_01027 [Colletotrichum chrysophilum]|uniref:Uncharacterized protein n=1 Tax=Colletotrichum chrysophilum TaxID=1836956 RepID=A0AAD9B2P1_9PEZI|nr:hypothetical protein CCHR01_01027 [Colletotrichum chrysophilum]
MIGLGICCKGQLQPGEACRQAPERFMARIWKTRKDTRWKPKATITYNPACSAAASRHVEPHVIAIGGSFGGTATRAAELAHSSHPLSAPAANLNFVSQLFCVCHFHHHHQHDQRHNLPPLLCRGSAARSRPTPFTDAIALRVFRPSLLVPGQPGLACAVERTSVAV